MESDPAYEGRLPSGYVDGPARRPPRGLLTRAVPRAPLVWGEAPRAHHASLSPAPPVPHATRSKGSSPTFYKDKHKSLQQKNLLPARIPYAGKPGSAGAKRAAAAGGSGLQRRLSAAGGLTGGSSSHSGGLESSFSASKEDNKEDEDEKEEDEGMRGSREDERASDEEGRDEDMEGEAESDLIMRLTQRTTDKAASRKNGAATKRRNNASREEE